MEFLLVHCWTCTQTFFTLTEMCAHHLDAHEPPLPARACRRFEAAEAPLPAAAAEEGPPHAA